MSDIFMNSEGHVIRNSLVDEHSIVKITEKTPDAKNIGKVICGETNSNILTFEINRFYDNVDLREKNIKFIIKTPSFTFEDYASNVQYNSNILRFSWLIPYSATQEDGTVEVAIEFFNESYSLKTLPFNIKIEKSISTDDMHIEVPNNWYIDIESRVLQLENGLNGNIDEVVEEYLNNNPIQAVSDDDVINIVERAGYVKSEDINLTDYAKITDIPSNKDILENITQNDIESWNSGGSEKTEVSQTNTVGFYNTSAFLGDNYTLTPTSEAFVSANGNFLKFTNVGTADVTNSLVDGETITLYGVDITLNEDGSITLNGTSTDAFYINTNITDEFRIAIIGQNVKISLVKSNTTNLIFNSGLAFNDASYGYNLTQTNSYSGLVTSELLTGTSRLAISSGVSFENLTASAMLELENPDGYLDGYVKSDCEIISESTVYSIADYPYVKIVGEHTIKYFTSGGNESINADEILKIKKSNLLYEKKVTCIGDSLCYGQSFSGGYCTILSELEPDTTFINKGLGGSQISSNREEGGNWWIENQLDGISEDTDYIICEGYLNDYFTGCELGTISDGYDAELDTTKFYGGMESLCKKLVTDYTEKKFGFIIAHSHYVQTALYENKLYLEAVRKCCDKWGVPYLDLSNVITPLVPTYKTTFYSDEIHYNEAGYRRITPAIREWIKTL